MCRRLAVLAILVLIASSTTAVRPAQAGVVPSGAAAVNAPAAASDAQPTEVTGRTTCQGSITTVMTNLYGPVADLLEELQGKYEDADGFRAVVYDGSGAAIVVAPDAIDRWQVDLAGSDVAVVASCVPTSLVDAARKVVDGTDVGPTGFSSVGYDSSLDAVTIITTAPTAGVIEGIEAAAPGTTTDALADGTLRITPARPGDFGAASRGADTSPFWGGAKISTDKGGCTTGFYLNSSTNGTVMLTAGHCYSGNGVSTQNGNHTAVVGTSEGFSIDPDTALIDGQSYFHHSYSGNDQTSHSGSVLGARGDVVASVAWNR